MTNREFYVRVGVSQTEYIKQEEGVFQESMLSTNCFTIAINDIVQQLSPDVQHTLYIDSTTVIVLKKQKKNKQSKPL